MDSGDTVYQDYLMEWLKVQRYSISPQTLKATESYTRNQSLPLLGRRIRPRALMVVWYRLLAESGLPHITFHDLRHTHASLLLKSNVHPKIVSERLGHASVQITLDTYSHLLPNMQKEAAGKLGEDIFGSVIDE